GISKYRSAVTRPSPASTLISRKPSFGDASTCKISPTPSNSTSYPYTIRVKPDGTDGTDETGCVGATSTDASVRRAPKTVHSDGSSDPIRHKAKPATRYAREARI